MKQFSAVFNFELMNYLKKKSYIVVTVVIIAIILVVMSIPLIMGSGSASSVSADAGTTDAGMTKIAVSGVDNVDIQALSATLAQSGYEVIEAAPDEVQAQVETGEFESAIVLTGPLSYTRYVREKGMYDTFEGIFDEALKSSFLSAGLDKLGAAPQEKEQLLNPLVTSELVLTASGTDQEQSFLFTYVLIFVLYMAIIIYGQFVASSVATEKSSRAMELLITTADPKNLIFGKVFGTGIAGLLQFALIILSGFVFYNVNAQYYAGSVVEFIFNIPPSLLVYFVLFFVLGFFIYAFVYAALGSLVSRMEDLGTAIQPVTFIFVAAFLVVVMSMSSGNIDNPAMLVCSYIPFTSPMAMFTRIAMSSVPPWEIAISLALLVVGVIGVGLLATGIYRLGVLMYGKPPKLNAVFKMLKNGR